jgi:hypothetical protein
VITDVGYKLWDEESLVLSAGSSKYSSYVDLGSLDVKNWDQWFEDVFLHIVIAEDCAGNSYLDFQLQTSPDHSTWTTILRTFDAALSWVTVATPRTYNPKKGTVINLVKQRPKGARYIRVGVTSVVNATSAGKVTATLVLNAQTAGRI